MKLCPILKRFGRGLIRSGYMQASYEMQRQGLQVEAARLRAEALKDD
jgi:hypothetical protein